MYWFNSVSLFGRIVVVVGKDVVFSAAAVRFEVLSVVGESEGLVFIKVVLLLGVSK